LALVRIELVLNLRVLLILTNVPRTFKALVAVQADSNHSVLSFDEFELTTLFHAAESLHWNRQDGEGTGTLNGC
jgi:hypothetical protein